MAYQWMRLYMKFVLNFFIKKLEVEGRENIPKNKPILFACFHPNSFFDAIVLNCQVKAPVWSLTRGDAFRNPIANVILTSFNMIPIHRLSEGKAHLKKNMETFNRCNDIFKAQGQILIYSEGMCKNQFELITPLKNGTVRIAQEAWAQNIDLQVVAAANNYTHYNSWGKNMTLKFGNSIKKEDVTTGEEMGVFTKNFNELLIKNMQAIIHRKFGKVGLSGNPLYYFGWIVNFPLYLLILIFTKFATKNTVFFDSVAYGLLVCLLPFYWLILFAVVMF